MLKFGQASLAGCPEEWCPCESEDHSHLLHCKMDHRVEIFHSLYDNLATIFVYHKIDPHLCRVLKMLVGPYLDDTVNVNFPLNTRPSYNSNWLSIRTLSSWDVSPPSGLAFNTRT
jgi:hypothetical protein